MIIIITWLLVDVDVTCNFQINSAYSYHNNLAFNRSKTVKVIFADKRRRKRFTTQPSPLRGINRSNTIKNKKFRYREEHSASVVLSWCTLWHLSRDKQQINVLINHLYETGQETYWIPQNTLQRSRSFKVTDFGTNRKPIRLPISD